MNYARLPQLLAEVNSEDITDVTEMVDALGEATRAFRSEAGGRQFHSTVETRIFDGDGCSYLYVGDLISVTTLKFDDDGDGTYEITLSATDYWLWPANRPTGYAARRIDLNPNGSYPKLPSGQRKVQIVGKWGHSEITEAVIVNGSAVTGTLSSTSDLSLVVSAECGDKIAIGDTLFQGTEEHGPVVDVSGTTITLQARGINGTTAAAQSSVAVYVRRYPADIERAVRSDAARHLWRAHQGFPNEGQFREMWPAIKSVVLSYMEPAAVIP